MKRIYIAGPMQGKPHFNYPKFGEIATTLRLGGWVVVSPVEIGDKFGTANEINDNPDLRAKVMDAELEAVEKCDAIYLLDGWQNSPGAKGELAVALAHGLQVILEGPRHVMR